MIVNGLITLENFAVVPVDREILALNDYSEKYGITLLPEEAREISEIRQKSLADNERIEFGLGAVAEIIRRFCRSRYVTRDNYAYIIGEVTDLFYYIKTDTDDRITDRELADMLYIAFEQRCRGSVEILESREAEIIIRKVNAGENYEKWFGARDRTDDESRVSDENARRNEDGSVDGYLEDEDGTDEDGIRWRVDDMQAENDHWHITETGEITYHDGHDGE